MSESVINYDLNQKKTKVHNPDRRVNTDGAEAENSRMEALPAKNKAKLNIFTLKAQLPSLKVNVPLSLTSSDIMELFSLISR